MTRLLLVAAVALALPAAALAKGPSEATLTGPGLDGRVPFEPYGELSGLYASSLRPERPAGALGPRYDVTWTFPSASGLPAEVVRQDVYPYAEPLPVTFTPPGQQLWGQVHGSGWYVSSPRLREVLFDAGLPGQPPATVDPVWPWLLGAAVLLAALGWTAWFARARLISIIRTPSVS